MADVERIGVAIEVPAPFGEFLRAQRKSFGDEQADKIPSHVTLLPPTLVGDDELTAMCERLGKVAAQVPSFELRLQGTGTFRPISPVVFVGLAEGIAQVYGLESKIRDELDDHDAEFPYHPHVTIAHYLDDQSLDHAQQTLARYGCQFWVDHITLYRHLDETGWVTHRCFGLA